MSVHHRWLGAEPQLSSELGYGYTECIHLCVRASIFIHLCLNAFLFLFCRTIAHRANVICCTCTRCTRCIFLIFIALLHMNGFMTCTNIESRLFKYLEPSKVIHPQNCYCHYEILMAMKNGLLQMQNSNVIVPDFWAVIWWNADCDATHGWWRNNWYVRSG